MTFELGAVACDSFVQPECEIPVTPKQNHMRKLKLVSLLLNTHTPPSPPPPCFLVVVLLFCFNTLDLFVSLTKLESVVHLE